MKRFIKKAGDFFYPNLSAWLLGLSALLAVLMCYLPVPAFVFGQEVSGTTSTGCSCSVNHKCNGWISADTTSTCTGEVWENCSKYLKGKTVKCKKNDNLIDKKLPWGDFVYEQGGTFCQNGGVHTGEGGIPEHDSAIWERSLSLDTSKEKNSQKKITFKPKAVVTVAGFYHDNVCTNSVGEFKISSRAYASLDACGLLNVDSGTTGWISVEDYIFKKKDGVWQFTSGKNPWLHTFNIETQCACTDESITEHFGFQVAVEVNDGVKFGADDTNVKFIYHLLEDTTTCGKCKAN